MKSSYVLTKLAVLVIFSLGTTLNSNAQAEETKTASTSNWLGECISASTPPTGDLVKIIQAKGTRNFKWSKKDSEDISHALEVFQINCNELTEDFWRENGAEITAELSNSRNIVNALYSRYLKSIPSTISCYKAGVIKKISGKSPVCPKGFKQVKK